MHKNFYKPESVLDSMCSRNFLWHLNMDIQSRLVLKPENKYCFYKQERNRYYLIPGYLLLIPFEFVYAFFTFGWKDFFYNNTHCWLRFRWRFIDETVKIDEPIERWLSHRNCYLKTIKGYQTVMARKHKRTIEIY